MTSLISKRLIVGLIALAAGLTLVGLILARSTPAQKSTPTQPKITWSEKQVEVVLSPGESASKSLTFASALDLQNITIEAVPEVSGFLSIQPNSFANIPANQLQQVTLDFAISSGATLGTLEGTIHVRNASQTLSQPLKVVIHVAGIGAAIFLPPDPSEAGKATLEGIDADRNGVRDDVQRYIALTYPDSERTRTVLTHYATAQQKFLLSADNATLALIARSERVQTMDCLDYLRPSEAVGIRQRARAEILNTLLRAKAYNLADAKLSGQTFSITPDSLKKQQCQFDPDTMGN